MKKCMTMLLVMLICTITSYAQDYKISKNSGSIVINEVNNVEVEGTAGNEIIFSSRDRESRDEKTTGLRAINSNGLEDNTGLGLSVSQKADAVEVYQLKKMNGPKVRIQVPRGVKIVYHHTSPYGSEVKLSNLENEIEIYTVYNRVSLDNVTGPIEVNTIHAEVDALFTSVVKNPVSIKSTHGVIDITVPAATKATLDLSTKYGDIFVDPELKIEVQNRGEWKVYGANEIDAKLNGGGLNLQLGSVHNTIYLRKAS